MQKLNDQLNTEKGNRVNLETSAKKLSDELKQRQDELSKEQKNKQNLEKSKKII